METLTPKQTFFNSMDTLPFFPQTEIEVDWFEEWLDLHPKEREKMNAQYKEYCEQQSSEYMVFKILLRSFLEENIQPTGTIFSLAYEPRTKMCTVLNPGNGNSYRFKL